jgi:hypothetical protein
VTGTAPARPSPAATAPAPGPPAAAAPAAPAAASGQQSGGGLAARYAARPKGADGAGAILALFAYPLLVAALKGGPAAAKGWLAAKFINQPYQAAGPGSHKGKTPRPVTRPPRRPGPGPVIRP